MRLNPVSPGTDPGFALGDYSRSIREAPVDGSQARVAPDLAMTAPAQRPDRQKAPSLRAELRDDS